MKEIYHPYEVEQNYLAWCIEEMCRNNPTQQLPNLPTTKLLETPEGKLFPITEYNTLDKGLIPVFWSELFATPYAFDQIKNHLPKELVTTEDGRTDYVVRGDFRKSNRIKQARKDILNYSVFTKETPFDPFSNIVVNTMKDNNESRFGSRFYAPIDWTKLNPQLFSFNTYYKEGMNFYLLATSIFELVAGRVFWTMSYYNKNPNINTVNATILSCYDFIKLHYGINTFNLGIDVYDYKQCFTSNKETIGGLRYGL